MAKQIACYLSVYQFYLSDFRCSHSLTDACLRYDTQDLPQKATITNASLWFFKTNRRAQNFTLTIISDTTGIGGKIFQLYQANSHKRGWFGLQISSVLTWWQHSHKNNSEDITFKVRNQSTQAAISRSFLEFVWVRVSLKK